MHDRWPREIAASLLGDPRRHLLAPPPSVTAHSPVPSMQPHKWRQLRSSSSYSRTARHLGRPSWAWCVLTWMQGRSAALCCPPAAALPWPKHLPAAPRQPADPLTATRAVLPQVPTQRYRLALLPTPIHPWPAPGVPPGCELHIKRDDLTGMQLSGNKVGVLFTGVDGCKAGERALLLRRCPLHLPRVPLPSVQPPPCQPPVSEIPHAGPQAGVPAGGGAGKGA